MKNSRIFKLRAKNITFGLSPLALLTLSACGGGGTSSGGGSFSVGGNVIKGPLSNALVGLDYDGDGVVDSSTVRTGSDGSYSISTSNSIYTVVAVTDDTTVDTSSGVVLSGVTLKAPKGATVVTPTTTLMEEGNLTSEQVASVLGLPDGVDPTSFNPYASGVDATQALAVEKASQQVMSVVTAFASAAEGAGASEADAFKAALNSVVEVVKTKAAKLSDPTASAADKSLDLTNATDLALIKTQAISEVSSTSGVNATAFNALADDTATAVKNVNDKIATVSDLTSDASKNVFSTTQVLADQVKTAATAEVSSAGSGNITFTDANVVNTAASNNAPTDITLSSSSISEAASSLAIGTLSTTDSDQPSGVAFAYELAGADSAAFSINQATGELSLISQPDYETKSSYSITILSTDEGGKTVPKDFTITVADANDAPTGSVLITGTPAQGEVLTADTSSIADEDGLGTLSYQWQADGANITGATNKTLTLSQDQVGKQISVSVSYTDDGGNAETVASSYEAEVINLVVTVDTGARYKGGGATGNVFYIDGEESPTLEFIQGNTYIFDQSNSSNSSHPLQFQLADGTAYTDGVTSSGTAGTAGATVTFVVPDDAPAGLEYYCTIHGVGMGGAVTTAAPMIVSNVNDDPSGDVTIAGTLTQGSTLTVVTNTLEDADGLGELSYQWTRDGSEIVGASSATYTLSADDLGTAVAVAVSYTDAYGTAESKTSATKTISTNTNQAPTLTVPTGGTVTEDATTTTITGTLSASDPEDDSPTYSVVGSTATDGSYSVTGTYGTLVLNASTGAYTYTLNNAATATNALTASDSKTESFSVQVTDETNTPAAQSLSFTIQGANDAPSAPTLSSSSVDENVAGDSVGTLSSSDAEGQDVSYTVADSGYGASFEVDGSTLKLKSSVTADAETKSSYTVTVNAGDGADSTSSTFTISVGDTNEAPTLTVPTGGSVTEDATTTTIAGTLSASDPEDDSPTYSVVGSTATDGSYSVTGTYGTLVLNASTGAYTYTLNNAATATNALTASDSKTESFSVQVTDGTNTPAAQSLSFTIQGANDAPVITVSGLSSIAENQTNAVAATVSASDVEDGSKTVSLSGNGRDDAKFEVVDGNLRIKTSADYEEQDEYQIQLSVTDSGGTTTLRNLEFSVTDASEAMSGSVVDGYVAGATIFQDLNNNNILDSDEPFTVTSSTGDFVLSGIVASKTAPLKMISGFDIGTNQPIVTSLGVPTTLSGEAVASPIATITSISQAGNVEASLEDVVDRVATYFDVSTTSQSNANILNDDPIENLTSSDSDTANAAKDVFEANQFIMGLTHVSEKAGKYLADQIDSAIQNAGDNSYGTYAGGASSSYEKLGADAFLNTAATHIMTPVTPTSSNAFQISSAQIEWNDYDPTLGVDVTNRVESTTTGNQMSLGSDAVALNLQNLTNAANTSGSFKSPTLSFELLKVPTGSGSGTISFSLIDGSDATRSGSERQINIDIAVNWDGDGESATITIPVQDVTGSYVTSSGLTVDITIANLDSDAISVSKAGANYPSTLDVKLGAIIDKLETVGSSSLLQEGTFNLNVTTDLPLSDASGTSLTSVSTNIELVEDTPLEVFVQDVTYFEDDASPLMKVYLNRPHTEDVTITYDVAAAGTDTATAGSDFTGQSAQTVTILAGLTSATVAVPILSDSSVESAETFSVTATAVSAGSLKKASGTVTLEDSDTTVSTSGELDSLASDVVTSMAFDIGDALFAAYESAATSASATLSVSSSDVAAAAATVTPGLTTVMKAFYGIVSTEITTAATNNTAAADFAQALMTANSATKLFDPSTIIGSYINGDGTYIGANDLASLTAAIQSEYDTFK
ncbi:VCBS domain-containing protein, partial [Paracoccaceae bacterium]|nr:VCBS domain-containing protein [Paracoccaceae bacterium]